MNPRFPRTAPNCGAERFLQLSNTTNHLAPISLPAVAGQKANTAIRITSNAEPADSFRSDAKFSAESVPADLSET